MGSGKRLEVAGADGGDGWRRSIHGMGVRMVVEIGAEKGLVRNVGRVFVFLLQGRKNLRPHALDRVGVELRFRKRHAQKTKRVLRIVRERDELHDQKIAVGRHGQFDRANGERGVKRIRIELSRAFVEQIRREIRQPILALRIVGRPGGKGGRHRDHRQGVIRDVPDLFALGRRQSLHVERARGRRRHCGQHRQPHECARRVPHFHWRGPGTRVPVTASRLIMSLVATCLTVCAATARMRSGHSSTSSTVKPIARAWP